MGEVSGVSHKVRNLKRVERREHLVLIDIGTSARAFGAALGHAMHNVPKTATLSGIEREDDCIAFVFDYEILLEEKGEAKP
jgi:hypothetical protein